MSNLSTKLYSELPQCHMCKTTYHPDDIHLYEKNVCIKNEDSGSMCRRNDVHRRPISPVARANTNQYGQDQAEESDTNMESDQEKTILTEEEKEALAYDTFVRNFQMPSLIRWHHCKSLEELYRILDYPSVYLDLAVRLQNSCETTYRESSPHLKKAIMDAVKYSWKCARDTKKTMMTITVMMMMFHMIHMMIMIHMQKVVVQNILNTLKKSPQIMKLLSNLLFSFSLYHPLTCV